MQYKRSTTWSTSLKSLGDTSMILLVTLKILQYSVGRTVFSWCFKETKQISLGCHIDIAMS